MGNDYLKVVVSLENTRRSDCCHKDVLLCNISVLSISRLTEFTIILCQNVKLQLSDSELNIVQGIRTTEVEETKAFSSWQLIVLSSHRHIYADKVAPERPWLPQPPQKGTENNSYWHSQHFLCASTSAVQDEWKLVQAQDDVSAQDIKKVVEDYWNVVLQLKSVEGINHYQSLQLVTL